MGDFVGQLQQLEQTLTGLFTTTAPQLLDGLLANPTGFVNNFISAGQLGFSQFFNLNTLSSTLQNVVLTWVQSKVPPDIALTAQDLPTNASAAQIGGFALKVMGLTWDDFTAKVAAKIGPSNAQLLAQAYNFLQPYLTADNSQAGFLNDLSAMLGNALTQLGDATNASTLLDLSADQLKSMAVNAIQNQVLNALVPAVVKWAVSAFNPAGGAFRTLLVAADWMVTNIKQVNSLAQAVQVLGNDASQIAQGAPRSARWPMTSRPC